MMTVLSRRPPALAPGHSARAALDRAAAGSEGSLDFNPDGEGTDDGAPDNAMGPPGGEAGLQLEYFGEDRFMQGFAEHINSAAAATDGQRLSEAAVDVGPAAHWEGSPDVDMAGADWQAQHTEDSAPDAAAARGIAYFGDDIAFDQLVDTLNDVGASPVSS